MSLRHETKLRDYAHATDNVSQFIKGILLGSGAGLIVVSGCVVAAYALGFPGIQEIIDELLGWHSFAL